MAGLFVLALFGAGYEIYVDQDSYAHAYLGGECAKDPALKACHPVGRAFGGQFFPVPRPQ